MKSLPFNPFKLPSPMQVAEADLAQAERDLLRAHQNAEYWQAMQRMLTQRVERLRQMTNRN